MALSFSGLDSKIIVVLIPFKGRVSFLFHISTHNQRAKKVVSNSPGLVDFAIGQVNSVFNLPDWQVMFYEEFE